MQNKFPWYNTVGLNHAEAQERVVKATTQTTKILHLFKVAAEPLTPFDCAAMFARYYKAIPITSVRRAITDLTAAGHLVKTNIKGMGEYGITNYKWRLKTQ